MLNWVNLWNNEGKNEDDLLKIFSKMGPIVPEITPKFLNTLAFYKKLST